MICLFILIAFILACYQCSEAASTAVKYGRGYNSICSNCVISKLYWISFPLVCAKFHKAPREAVNTMARFNIKMSSYQYVVWCLVIMKSSSLRYWWLLPVLLPCRWWWLSIPILNTYFVTLMFHLWPWKSVVFFTELRCISVWNLLKIYRSVRDLFYIFFRTDKQTKRKTNILAKM